MSGGGLITSLYGSQAAPKRDWQPRSFRGTSDEPQTGRPTRDSLQLSRPTPQSPAPAVQPQRPAAPIEERRPTAPQEEASFRNARFSELADLQEVLAGGVLKAGASGDGVKAVQQALYDLGFALDGGPDGAFGGKTVQALKNFQASQKLPLTGKLDAQTLRALDEVAPAPGLKAWEDPNLSPKAYEQPQVVRGKTSRVVVGIAQHRLFMFDANGKLEKIMPVASGKIGTDTQPGIKVVDGRVADPTAIARRLWPESGGKAFGTRLIGLSWLDEKTGRISHSGEEIHGTYARDSIGTYASKGCMRLFNENVEEVYQKLRVGDVVVVRP